MFHRRSGPAVLLLHGFRRPARYGTRWRRCWPGRKHFTVVTADLRGHGASSKPEGVENYTFREMGRDMAALMAALGHDRFDLAGHDRGARVAHRMALTMTRAGSAGWC
ncbi:MAG: alpha/beta fold hydrolase [Defluviimonas denitrificans]